MQPEATQNPTVPQPHIWSIFQIIFASYLAGPVAGSYLLGRNYKESGFPDTAKKCYIAGIIGTFLLMIIISFIPDELMSRVPKTIIPIAYTSLIMSIAHYQKKIIQEKFTEGNKRFSFFRCLLLSVSFVVIQGAIILLAYSLSSIME